MRTIERHASGQPASAPVRLQTEHSREGACWRVFYKSEPRFRYFRHYHLEHELFVPLSVGEWLVGERSGLYRPGEAYLLGPRVPHLFQSSDFPARARQKAFVLFFDLAALPPGWDALGQAASLSRRSAHGLRFGTLGERLAPRLRELSRLEGLAGAARLLDVLDLLDRAEAEALCPRPAALDSDVPGDTRLDRLLRAAHAEADDADVTVARLAEIAGVPLSTAERLFRQALGRGLQAYLLELRLGRVCNDLATTDRAVTEIALARGFNTLSHFNRLFRRAQGCSPRDYRLQRHLTVPGHATRVTRAWPARRLPAIFSGNRTRSD